VNGLEFTEWIRQDGTSPPVVILTNHDLPEYRLEAARIGADRFLSKTSSTTEEIVVAIEELVGERATREDSNDSRRGPLTLPNTYG
jgi:DNA-binding NarL/FixJ family response regulator